MWSKFLKNWLRILLTSSAAFSVSNRTMRLSNPVNFSFNNAVLSQLDLKTWLVISIDEIWQFYATDITCRFELFGEEHHSRRGDGSVPACPVACSSLAGIHLRIYASVPLLPTKTPINQKMYGVVLCLKIATQFVQKTTEEELFGNNTLPDKMLYMLSIIWIEHNRKKVLFAAFPPDERVQSTEWVLP